MEEGEEGQERKRGEDLRPHVDFALELAREAGRTIMPFFRGDYATEIKPDASPVTEADRGAEQVMRRRLAERFPDDAVLGEEFGSHAPAGSARRWILDPIDGTVSFINGVPLFATLVALEVDAEPVLGVAHFPALDETVWAARGLGCHFGEDLARVRPCASVKEAVVCASGMHGTDVLYPDGPTEGEPRAGLGALIRRAHAYRGWGDAYGHVLVATGRADVMVDPVMAPWDIAALVPIVEEAGGRLTTLAGGRENVIDGGSLISTAGPIHEEVLRILAGD